MRNSHSWSCYSQVDIVIYLFSVASSLQFCVSLQVLNFSEAINRQFRKVVGKKKMWTWCPLKKLYLQLKQLWHISLSPASPTHQRLVFCSLLIRSTNKHNSLEDLTSSLYPERVEGKDLLNLLISYLFGLQMSASLFMKVSSVCHLPQKWSQRQIKIEIVIHITSKVGLKSRL